MVTDRFLNGYTPQDSLYCSPVNNTGLDPLQGFDFKVWVQDVCTGKIAWFGEFQSLTLSIRNATETYLTLGQRIPVHLDGEIQIAWVLEQGMVDFRFIQRAFGVDQIRRDMYLTRGPRFQISFDANANELEKFNQRDNPGVLERDMEVGYRQGADEYFGFQDTEYAGAGPTSKYRPTAVGRYDILRCKLDSISMGITPGRRVAAVRYEGVAEGISFVEQSVQTFKTTRGELGRSYGGFIANEPKGSAPITNPYTSWNQGASSNNMASFANAVGPQQNLAS